MEKIPFVLYAESEHHLKSLVPVKKKKALKGQLKLQDVKRKEKTKKKQVKHSALKNNVSVDHRKSG